jgi:hypothetical protein
MTSQVTAMKRPFAPTGRLAPDLDRVEAYWRSLLRGSAQIPFWDDFNPTVLPDIAGRLFLMGVYPGPDRFRFDQVGADITAAGHREVEGLFADETPPATPFEFLIAQCAATVEAGESTLYRHEPAQGRGYSRLILPMWGDGRIGMLLGAIDWSGLG